MPEPVIQLKNVGVAYSSHLTMFRRRRYWGVKDLTLDVYQGETLGIVGRNGAGKSTLLKLLANIFAPDAGTMIHRTKRVSLLSLQVGFNQHLSGRENAILSGILLGMSRRQVERQMDEIFAFAELENFIDAPVHSYSSGMKARLGFGVAFQADPDVLLVDEVLGVGDEQFKEKSSAAMREKIRSNKTVVIVSHHGPTIRELCNRVIWIENGLTMAMGSASEVLAKYHEASGGQPISRRA